MPEPQIASDDLFEQDVERALPLIAAALSAHIAGGGSISEGVRLVETLERALNRRPKVAKNGSAQTRGSRLSPDWQPSTSDFAYALDRQMPRNAVENEAEKFRNYWVAKFGASATKRDWSATWRNWIHGNGAWQWLSYWSNLKFQNRLCFRTSGDWIKCRPCRHGSPCASRR